MSRRNTCARPRNSRPIVRSAISTHCSVSSTLERSRATSKSARERVSRCVATRAWKRRPAVSWPVIRPTASITAKVSRYCTSLTANDMRGETKKKSNAATFKNAASTAGPRPNRTATPTTASRNSITMLARAKIGVSGVAIRVVTPQAAAAHR